MLEFLQFILDAIQSVHALLEITRQVREQRCDLRVLEVLELGDDVIALLAGLHPVDEAFHALVAEAVVVQAFREHTRKEQGEIADVLADLALAIEGRSGTVDRVGFEQHSAHIVDGAIGGIMNFEELLSVAELG